MSSIRWSRINVTVPDCHPITQQGHTRAHILPLDVFGQHLSMLVHAHVWHVCRSCLCFAGLAWGCDLSYDYVKINAGMLGQGVLDTCQLQFTCVPI